MMKNPLFTGVCTALVTPFIEDEINYPLMEKLLQRQIDAGITAVVLCGTTGEGAALSDLEKLEIFKRSKEFAGDRLKIICGTGSNNTRHVIRLSQAAQDAGADGLLVVAPYYNKGNLEGQRMHYTSIAHAVDIPVILYNVPGRTGVDLSVKLYQQLSAIPNIIGVKEASSDITKISRIISACGPEFSVWSGNDDMAVAEIALGAMGIISVVSNVCPEETNQMANAALNGDYCAAAKEQEALIPLIDALFKEVNPIPVKTAMKCIGYDCGPCRLPLGPASDDTVQILRELLQ